MTTTPRPNLVSLPILTEPSELTTYILAQDSAVNQMMDVPTARALLQVPVGFTGSEGVRGPTGFTGSRGFIGFTGSTGTQGVIGFTGSRGNTSTITVGLVTVSTSTASVTNVGTPYDAIFDFVLQRGPIGYTGSKGNTGTTSTIAVGLVTVSTSTASVTNVGTQYDAIFDFVLQRGPIGYTGSEGPTTATNVAGGSTGSLLIQAATSVTTFIPIGAVGTYLRSDGLTANWASTSSLRVGYATYADQEFISALTTASTPALRYPTMAIGGNGYAGIGVAQEYTYDTNSKVLTAGGVTLTNTTSATSITSGALTVAGGVGIGGDLHVGGILYVDYVNTATNLKGGTAGQVPFQTSTGVTKFFGPGTAGDVLVSGNTNGPRYQNTLTLAGATSATSTITGALIVAGGVGIGGNLYVGGEIVADKLTIQLTTVTTTLVVTDDIIKTYNSTQATSTITGALIISGGAGIGGDLYVGGSIYSLNTVAGSATNIAGGTTGQVLFQSATSSTAFAGPGNTGDLLVSRGANVLGPQFVSTTSLMVGYATTALNVSGSATINTATNLAGGTTSSIVYQSSPGVTAFLAASNTSSWILSSNGVSSPPSWVPGADSANYSNTATNLAGGTAGQVPYQTAPGVTSFFGAGTAGNVLVSNGTTAPTYNNTLTLVSVTSATSTQTGALQVRGGVGIGGDLYVGGQIYGLSEITAYYGSPSDSRLKTNIVNINNGLAKVLTLDGVTYNWNELAIDKDLITKEVGVIAQQIRAVLPEAVVEKENGYLTVKYERIIPLLIEAIKELSAEVEELKKKIQ